MPITKVTHHNVLSHLAFIPSSRPQNRKHGFVALFFAALVAAVTPLCAAEKSNIVPCNIRLVFVDDNGMSVVSHDLEMHKQPTRPDYSWCRHWLNSQAEVIGKQDATCGAGNTELNSHTQKSRRQFKKISGHLLEQLGQDTDQHSELSDV